MGNSFAKTHLTMVMVTVETIFLKVLSYTNLLGPGDATLSDSSLKDRKSLVLPKRRCRESSEEIFKNQQAAVAPGTAFQILLSVLYY